VAQRLEAHRELVVVLILVGYAVALPALLWMLHDLARIPRGLWRYAASRPPQAWRAALIAGYACSGWPSLVVALSWWRSRERGALLEDWADMHARNERSRGPG
jgi:hypothetical protein